MSFIKKIFSGATGGGSGTGGSQQFSGQGVDEIQKILQQVQQGFSPFTGAGVGEIGNLQERQTPGGLDSILGQLANTDIFKTLTEERGRAVQGQAAASGQSRSGAGLQAAAQVPTDVLLGLENLLFGRNEARSNQLFGGGLQAQQGLGGLQLQGAGQIGNLFGQKAGIEATAVGDRRQRQASFVNNLVGGASQVGAAFVSDPRFKTNIEKIGEVGVLNLYQWDWKDFIKPLLEKIPQLKPHFMVIHNIDTEHPPIGFMADEVQDIYPQHVIEQSHILTINYHDLFNELEAV